MRLEKFFYIEPEVSGGFGENAVIDSSVHPPKVSKLHLQLDGWLGNDLLETFPCFIVTEQLAKDIEKEGLSGCIFEKVEISKSDQFEELYPKKSLPAFSWLKVIGSPGQNDFGISNDFRLVISEKVMAILKTKNISEADIEDFQ